MTYTTRTIGLDARKISLPKTALVRFKPFDGLGAGRLAMVCDGDIVEYLGESDGWFHIRSIIIDDVRNIRHFDGWVKKEDGISFSKGHALADQEEE